MAATPNKQFKNICVLSGFNYGKHKEFVEATIDLGRSIAERNYIWRMEEVIEGYQNWSQKLLLSEEANEKLFICAHTANEPLDLLQAYRPDPDPWTFVLERSNNNGNSSRSKKCKLDLTLRL
ncbi:hypothetical protein WN943_006328 [Citrus x changshan-huyou]